MFFLQIAPDLMVCAQFRCHIGYEHNDLRIVSLSKG